MRKFAAFVSASTRHARAQRERRRAKFHRILDAAAEIERIVFHAELDSPGRYLICALVQERRGGEDAFRNTPIPRVGRIKEVGVNLHGVTLRNPDALYNAEVDAIDAVGAQNVAPGISDRCEHRGRKE